VASGDIPFPVGFSPLEALDETDYSYTGGAKGTFGKTHGRFLGYLWPRSQQDLREQFANAALYYDPPRPAPWAIPRATCMTAISWLRSHAEP
jgi:iron complex outermembrane receptor protein